MAHPARASLSLAQAGVGKEARKVVEAVAVCVGVIEGEVAAEEFAEMFVVLVFADHLFRYGVEGRGEDGEPTEDARGVGRETHVAQVEGGFYAYAYQRVCADALKARALVGELRGVVGGVEVNGHVEQAGGGADGERQVAAQVTYPVGDVRRDARRDARQEFARFDGLQLFERDALHARNRNRFARGDEQRRACGRQQRAHLRAVVGVVEQYQRALAFEFAAVAPSQFFQVVGQALLKTGEGADARGERVGGRARRIVCAAHVQNELYVGVRVAQAFGDVEGKLGLADAAHAADAGDGGAAAAAQRREQVGDLFFAPDEVTDGRA